MKETIAAFVIGVAVMIATWFASLVIVEGFKLLVKAVLFMYFFVKNFPQYWKSRKAVKAVKQRSEVEGGCVIIPFPSK